MWNFEIICILSIDAKCQSEWIKSFSNDPPFPSIATPNLRFRQIHIGCPEAHLCQGLGVQKVSMSWSLINSNIDQGKTKHMQARMLWFDDSLPWRIMQKLMIRKLTWQWVQSTRTTLCSVWLPGFSWRNTFPVQMFLTQCNRWKYVTFPFLCIKIYWCLKILIVLSLQKSDKGERVD